MAAVAVEAYLGALRRRGRSPRTIQLYGWALQDWIQHVDEAGRPAPQAWTAELIEAWQDGLLERWAPGSCNVAAAALRGFLRWQAARGLVDQHLPRLVTSTQVPERLPRPIPDRALAVLMAHFMPAPDPHDLVRLRNRALFWWLLTTAARVSEVLRLDREDLDHPRVRLKGGREHLLVPAPVARLAVRDYLRARRDREPALFCAHSHRRPERLTYAGVRGIWRRLAEQLELPPFSTHQLRHTGATRMRKAGVPLDLIAAQLGHRGLGQVQGYARLDVEQREHAVRRAWGIR